jgi:DNA-binding PadR family transcriptional regulator
MMRNPPSKSTVIGLTTPDLVVLTLLAERPMHGYELNAELERRDVRDWAGISRPQVYYSINKLADLGLLETVESGAPATGPDRRTYRPTTLGQRALADTLERSEWATQRPPPPFLTWLAMAWQARPGVMERMLQTRRQFVTGELARERSTLEAIRAEPGGPHTAALLMVEFAIRQFELELDWLAEVERRMVFTGPQDPSRTAPQP